jgi:urease accessory protein
MTTEWQLLQLVDGGFPSGGFAHSHGLEASLHLRGVEDLPAFLDEALWQAGRTTLPFVRSACEAAKRPDAEERLRALDELFDASCTNHVANRASRAQGRALASTCAQVWDDAAIQRVAAQAKRGPAHHAPVLGAVFGALGMGAIDAQRAFLHGTARGVVSAGVRLGVVGPIEGQRVLAEAGEALGRILVECMLVEPEDAAQAAPLVELFGALHERLDGRLFQS